MSLDSKLLTFENPVLRGYLTHATILVLKMMMMAVLTGRQRLQHRVYPSPEDVNYLKSLKGNKEGVNRHDEVERVRRAHRNDMENIPIFFMAALAYLLTDPNPAFALILFRIFTICRCAHTFVYAICVIPQPARAIAWFGGYFATGYMAVQVLSVVPTTAAHEWINLLTDDKFILKRRAQFNKYLKLAYLLFYFVFRINLFSVNLVNPFIYVGVRHITDKISFL